MEQGEEKDGENGKQKFSTNIELLNQEINKKNEIIENLQKENKELNIKNEESISLLNKEIKILKETYEKEINSLKDFFIKEINLLKEEISKKNNNNNEMEKKEEKKTKNEIKAIKEDINDLNEKYSSFERVFDNKLEFIESSLSKLMEKEGNEKDIKKDFENKLNNIFKKQNDSKEHIDQKDLEDLKKLALNLSDNGGSPLKESRFFFSKIFDKRVSETKDNMIIHNLISKKEEIFSFLDEFEYILNFNIPKFREEFNLSKEDYSDEYLISKFKENKGDKTKTFYSIINQNIK